MNEPIEYLLIMAEFALTAVGTCKNCTEEQVSNLQMFVVSRGVDGMMDENKLREICPKAIDRKNDLVRKLREKTGRNDLFFTSVDAAVEYWIKLGHNNYVQDKNCKVCFALISEGSKLIERGVYSVKYKIFDDSGAQGTEISGAAYISDLKAGDVVQIHRGVVARRSTMKEFENYGRSKKNDG